MSTTETNFLGIPIEGDITHSDTAVEQRPFEELQDAIRELLEYSTFTSLKWRQYTPFFNDGDPCVFGIHGIGLEVPVTNEEDREDIGDYEDGYIDLPNTYMSSYYSDETKQQILSFVGLQNSRTYNRETRTYDEPTERWKHEPDDPDMVEQATKVAKMIESGAYNNSLMKVFGDHAVVYLRQDKIVVEYYEHD